VNVLKRAWLLRRRAAGEYPDEPDEDERALLLEQAKQRPQAAELAREEESIRFDSHSGELADRGDNVGAQGSIGEPRRERRDNIGGDARRTEITGDQGEFTIEDLIAEEDMVVTISHSGYIKRTSVSTYRIQRRGGRGGPCRQGAARVERGAGRARFAPPRSTI
jgi:hypothetical protein